MLVIVIAVKLLEKESKHNITNYQKDNKDDPTALNYDVLCRIIQIV